MSGYQTLTIGQDVRGIAELTLNRPEKHNAMNAMMIAELADAAATLASDDTVRVVVLAASGPTFCAGGASSFTGNSTLATGSSGSVIRWLCCTASPAESETSTAAPA